MSNQKIFKDNKLFEFLDYIFKKSNTKVKDYVVPNFLINRWISMASPIYAKILNATTNKWLLAGNDIDITKFYRTILPHHKQKINYVKKLDNIKTPEEDSSLASLMECSQREINLFNQTLEELKLNTK